MKEIGRTADYGSIVVLTEADRTVFIGLIDALAGLESDDLLDTDPLPIPERRIFQFFCQLWRLLAKHKKVIIQTSPLRIGYHDPEYDGEKDRVLVFGSREDT